MVTRQVVRQSAVRIGRAVAPYLALALMVAVVVLVSPATSTFAQAPTPVPINIAASLGSATNEATTQFNANAPALFAMGGGLVVAGLLWKWFRRMAK